MSDETVIDETAWDALVAASDADVYFTPSYHRISEIGEGGRPMCLVARHPAGTLLVPGLVRDAAPDLVSGALDMQTCNGYGGPLLLTRSTPARDELHSMWASIRAVAIRERVVAAFFRLHPLLGNERWLPDDAEVRFDRQTTFIDTRLPQEVLWKRASTGHRNMVRKASRLGAEVRWNSAEDWRDFPALYTAAMERLAAPAALRFPPQYFSALAESSFADVAAVRTGSGLAAAAILLRGRTWAHYHLASRTAGADNSFSSAILDASVARSRSLGLAALHLGGGRTPAEDDTLLRFKSALGGDRLDYRVARVIFDQNRFAELTAAWTRRNGAAEAWLLPYRQPATRAEA